MNSSNYTDHKYFHCYATANDSYLYFKDLKNLKRIKKNDSGIDKIFLYIAISKVHKFNVFDRIFMKVVKKMFYRNQMVELAEIIYKSNIGRDFSSYQMMLDKVKIVSSENDYILFQNRSGYGPFHKNWYKKFVQQLNKFDSVALCGSTINFLDHPERSSRIDLPHIQTYSFLSKMYFMNMLGENFPGANETDRFNIIIKGEIGLSQFFLERKYKITCIEWPDEVIMNQSRIPVNQDIKVHVTKEHSFYHRQYFKKRRKMKIKRLSQNITKFLPAKPNHTKV